jgi:hypothetical protein
MLLHAAVLLNVKLKHVFLEPGHTYNEADSVHAMIERCSRRKEIFDLDEWVTVMISAKEKEPPYKVHKMKRTDFLNLHDLVEKGNWDKDTDGSKITWNKVKIVEADPQSPGILSVYYGYKDCDVHKLNTNQRRGHPVNLKTYKAPLAYPGKIPFNTKKIKDLEEQMKKLSIPSRYHDFYKRIIDGIEETEEECDADDPQVVADAVDEENLIDDEGRGLEQKDAERNEEEAESEDED